MIFCFFTFVCFLHSNLYPKDLFVDLEASIPNRSTVYVRYTDEIAHFSPRELLRSVYRDHVCDVVIFSNLKNPIQVFISSKESRGSAFAFTDSLGQKEMKFFLFDKGKKTTITNGSLLYSQAVVKEPITKIIPLGLKMLKVPKDQIISDTFSTNFTVLLKNIG